MSRFFVVPILLTFVVLTNAEAQQDPILLVSNIDKTQKTGPGSRLVAGESMAAIRFGAGDDSGGYALTGLDVKFHQDQGNGEEVQLELWSSGYPESNGDRPYARLLVFDNPDRVTEGDNAFTLPRPFYLNDGWTYFIVGRAPGYEPGNESTQWWFATTDSDGQSDRIDNNWWIANNTLRYAGSGAWPDDVTRLSRVPMIAIKGYELDRLVYNTGESTDGYHVVGDNPGGNWLAQVFTTGHDNEGYDLHSIAIALEEVSGGGLPTDGDHVTASLYTAKAVGGERLPDRKLFDFVSPTVFREGIDLNEFVAPEGSTLERDAQYAFVFRRNTGAWVYIRRTRDDDENGQDEWWIRNEVYKSTDGASWNSDTRALKMRLYGKRRTEAIPDRVLDIGADRTEREGSNFDVPVTLSETSERAVSVSFRGTGGTAAGSDYGHDGQPMVTIGAGQTTAWINFDVANDDAPEGEEYFFLELHGPTHAVIGRARARITIPANDEPPDNAPVDDAGAPFGTPANLTATLGDAAATLSWRAPAATANVRRYEYRYRAGGSYPSTWTRIDDSAPGGANAAGVTVTGLRAGVAYTFQVRAVSTEGETSDAATAATLPVCSRTSRVRNAILARLPGTNNCAEVTAYNLRSIDGELNLHGRGISSLKAGDFSGLNGLEFLKLSGNGLSALPAGAFDGLSAVRELSLQTNDLNSLPDGAFRGLTGPLWINMDGNEFTAFPGEALDDLGANLTGLDLGFNDLSSLPDDAFEDFERLRTINLENNDLTSLPAGVFDGVGALEYLYLGSNDLTSLPGGVFDDLRGLLHLYLTNNELTAVPGGAFDRLAALQDLDLGDNDLTSLPDGVFDGTRDLKRLNLKGNKLTALPEGAFEGLSKLTRVRLDGVTLIPGLLLEGGGVAVRVAEGAPFPMNVTLSAEGAELASTAATIPAGAKTSGAVAVTLRGGRSARGTITVASATFQRDPDDYEGLDIRTGAGLILTRGSGGLQGEAVPAPEPPPDPDEEGTAPTIRSIAFTSDPGRDNAYASGNLIEVTVTFSEQVRVTGRPQLELDFDGVAKRATYRGGTATTAVFSYRVRSADLDADGIAIGANKLTLHRASIWDTGVPGNRADVTHDAVPPDPGHKVNPPDVTAPVFVSAATSTDGTQVVLTFSERITVPALLRSIVRIVRVGLARFFIAVVGVTVDGDEVIPFTAGISWTNLIFTLREPVTRGQEVAVAYDNIFARDAVGIFIDEAGNALQNFPSRPVTNRSTVADSEEEDETPELKLSPKEFSVAEGENATYTVALVSLPTAAVTVAISSSSSKLSVSPENLSFTTENWNDPQTVTLTARQDDDDLNYWVSVSHTAGGGGYNSASANVYVVIQDDD